MFGLFQLFIFHKKIIFDLHKKTVIILFYNVLYKFFKNKYESQKIRLLIILNSSQKKVISFLSN